MLLVGGSGFVGCRLGTMLARQGVFIHLLTRKVKKGLSYPALQFEWDGRGEIPQRALDGVEAIVNLAGESIGSGRWSEAKKKKIVESRVQTTKNVVLAANKYGIKTLLQASAIGFYGDSKDQILSEDSRGGEGFLAHTVKEWEKSLQLLNGGTRLVVMRMGVVLGSEGGAFFDLTKPYLMGFGAMVGGGLKYFSFIHVEDICRFMVDALRQESFKGVYNLTAPNPVTYRELHESLLDYYSGFSWLKVPEVFLRLFLGKKSELVLTSQRVLPKRLMEGGFSFKYASIEAALGEILRKDLKNAQIKDCSQWVPKGVDNVWGFFSDEKNLEKLTPPFLHFHVDHMSTEHIEQGSIIQYKLKLHGLPIKWRSKISHFKKHDRFVDEQIKGPYETWHHTHSFEALGEGTLIKDRIYYRLPFGFLGRMVASLMVARDVAKIFRYRKDMADKVFTNG